MHTLSVCIQWPLRDALRWTHHSPCHNLKKELGAPCAPCAPSACCCALLKQMLAVRRSADFAQGEIVCEAPVAIPGMSLFTRWPHEPHDGLHGVSAVALLSRGKENTLIIVGSLIHSTYSE